jgi:hypothetical protein
MHRRWVLERDSTGDLAPTSTDGMPQLARHFDRVTLHRYPDALIVTEAKPLVAYALSTACAETLKRSLEAFVNLVERELAAKGAIHLAKDSGMFVATKA